MTTPLYTTDTYENDVAAQGANLFAAATQAEAFVMATPATVDLDGIIMTGWQEARFGDCWVKLYQRPELDADGCAVVDGIKCHVQGPGSHPGGKAWWLTPVAPVYVPVYAAAEGEN